MYLANIYSDDWVGWKKIILSWNCSQGPWSILSNLVMIMLSFFKFMFGHFKFKFKYVRKKADIFAAAIFVVKRRYMHGCLPAGSSSLASQSL